MITPIEFFFVLLKCIQVFRVVGCTPAVRWVGYSADWTDAVFSYVCLVVPGG